MTATLPAESAPRPEEARRASVPLIIVAGLTIVMVVLALLSFLGAMARLISAATMSAESIARGVSFPAAAIDGVSTGTFSFGRMAITSMFDGNDVPQPEAIEFTRAIRETVVPFYASEAINAALVLALSIVVLLLCLRLVRRRPFVRYMTWSLAAFAVITAVFSLASQLIRRAPFTDAASEDWTFRKDLATVISDLQVPLPPNTISDDSIAYTAAGTPFPVDLTLVGIAVLIGLIAAAFAIGERMQRDVEDLV
jgi:hypothetical protein